MPIETHLLMLEDIKNCKEKQQKKLRFNHALPKDPNCPAKIDVMITMKPSELHCSPSSYQAGKQLL